MSVYERIENVLTQVFQRGPELAALLASQYQMNCHKPNIEAHMAAIYDGIDKVDYKALGSLVPPDKIKLMLEVVAAFHDNTYIEGADDNEKQSANFLLQVLYMFPLQRSNVNNAPVLDKGDIQLICKVILQTKDYSGEDMYCKVFNKIDKAAMAAK